MAMELLEEKRHIRGSDPNPFYIVVGDFNGDSHMDIAVNIRTINGVLVFLGHCCNSFDRQTTIATASASQPHSIVVGDFNRKTYTNLMVTNEGADKIGILLNNDKQLGISVANYVNETVSVFLGLV
jgi:endonuclease/exonuclease/phosphatase family metal-dependent hydrolase